MPSSAIVIPARMGSTRFPGKPLVDLCGKPMIQWVYERALAAGVTDQVLVATPDEEIIEACRSFGAPAMKTRLEIGRAHVLNSSHVLRSRMPSSA